MPKFEVNLVKQLNFKIEVEAENEDRALDEAYSLAPELCAHCSGWRQEWNIDEDEWKLRDDEIKTIED